MRFQFGAAVSDPSDQFHIRDDFNKRRPFHRKRCLKRAFKTPDRVDLGTVSAAESSKGGEGRVHKAGLPHLETTGTLFLGDLAQLTVIEQNMGNVYAVFHKEELSGFTLSL